MMPSLGPPFRLAFKSLSAVSMLSRLRGQYSRNSMDGRNAMRRAISAFAILLTCLSALVAPAPAHADIQSTDYPSLQAAIDANPGRMVYVPDGDHFLTETVMIKTSGTGLCGPGRLIMTDASKDIINV